MFSGCGSLEKTCDIVFSHKWDNWVNKMCNISTARLYKTIFTTTVFSRCSLCIKTKCGMLIRIKNFPRTNNPIFPQVSQCYTFRMGVCLHAASHSCVKCWFLAAEPRGERSSLRPLKDLRAITEWLQLFIYLDVLLFVYFCIKARIKWLKLNIMKVAVPLGGGRGLLCTSVPHGLRGSGMWSQRDSFMAGVKLYWEREIMC